MQRQSDWLFPGCLARVYSNWLYTNLLGKELSVLSFILLLFLDAEEDRASNFVKKKKKLFDTI